MRSKPLDASWTRWLNENLDRQCDPRELIAILLEQQFSLESIRENLGHRVAPGALAPRGPARKRLDDGWKAWLGENIGRQCNPEQLLGILLKHQFSLDSVKESMGSHFPVGAAWLEEAMRGHAGGTDFHAISQPRLVHSRAALQAAKVDTDKLQLYVLDDFMTSAQCEAVVDLIGRHLRPSTVTLEATDRYFRTSRTCDLSLLADPVVAALDERIAETLGIRLSYSEGIQAQRYDVGQEFKPHTDFFEPGTDEYREHASARGNRTWTFMVYLNEGMEGGGTRFAAIGKTFFPRRGQALAWNNLYPDGTPNYETLHSGLPVERGHKIIITKWFREKGSGPMFYED